MSTQHPLISVVMSTYNDRVYLDDSIQSILNQTEENFEFIIIDDGSTDDSLACIQAYQKKNSRIVLIHHETSQGLTASLIEGCQQAKGTYIARQDSDDFSDPHRFERQLAFFNSHPDYVLVGTHLQLVDQNKQPLPSSDQRHPCVEDHQIRKRMTRNNAFSHGSVMFKKDCYHHVGGYHLGYRYSQDFDLFLRMIKEGQCHNLPHALYIRREMNQRITDDHEQMQIFLAVLALYSAKNKACYQQVQSVLAQDVTLDRMLILCSKADILSKIAQLYFFRKHLKAASFYYLKSPQIHHQCFGFLLKWEFLFKGLRVIYKFVFKNP